MSAGQVPRTLFVFGLLLFGPFSLSGQAVLTGLVREDATGRLLSGVELLVEGSSRSAVSDKSGEYAFKSVPKGRQVVLVRLVGFHPVRIRVDLGEGAVSRLDFTLVPFAVRLDPVVVAADVKRPGGMGREAFEERRSLGFGVFIDSLELRRSEDRRLSDLLRGRSGIVLAQSRFVTSSRTGCYMQIIYDGQSVYSPAVSIPPMPSARSARPARRPIAAASPFDINTFAVSDLESIEMYRSLADMPLEFGGASAGCGTVVLWSRRGGLAPKQ